MNTATGPAADPACDSRMPGTLRPSHAGVAAMRQMPLDLAPAEPMGLEHFLPGPNLEVLTWLRSWPDAAAPGTPAYLWGRAGAGKTHLLRGLSARALSLGWHVLWLGPRGFHSLGAGESEVGTLVLIDDCQALDAQQQHWAFNLFIENAAQAAQQHADVSVPGMAIVAAGLLPPVDLPVRDDLRTRLGWGLVFGVQALPEEGVESALQHEARRRGLPLAEGVLPYLMTRFSRDLGFLMALLERLDRYALAEQRVVTVPLLKQMLAQETP